MEFIETSAKSSPQRRAPLDVFFRPRNVAVIGATENRLGVGRSLLLNLTQTAFGGSVYPVNPNHSTLLGLRCYPNLREIPGKVDLAVIATPARTVPGVVRECVEAGVEGAVVISAGFRETGNTGAALEQEILREARTGKMRILGPNCLGIMSPHYGLNATFANSMARPGHLGFISQSGALCTAILDWSQRELVGFSAFVSVGSMLDVGWADLIVRTTVPGNATAGWWPTNSGSGAITTNTSDLPAGTTGRQNAALNSPAASDLASLMAFFDGDAG